MNITKTGLRQFLEAKIEKQRDKILVEKKRKIHEKVSAAVHAMVAEKVGLDDIKKVTESADKLSKITQEVVDRLPDLDYHRGFGFIATLNNMGNFTDNIIQEVEDVVFNHLRSGATSSYRNKHFRYNSHHINAAVSNLEKAELKIQDRLEKLNTLRFEIDNIITHAPKAKQAYDQLVSVGVDLSEYEGSKSLLPAVVKLSVDPNILVDGE